MLSYRATHYLRYVAAIGWALVAAACGSSPITASQPTVAQPATTLPNTATRVFLPARAAGTSAGPTATSQAPAPDSALAIVADTAVTPELSITVKGMFESDAVHNPKRILIIRQHGQPIYTDTTADFLYVAPFASRIYPLWVPTGPNAGELLLEVQSPPDVGLARRFFLQAGHVVKVDTLPIFEEKARNLDKDPRLELGGYRYSSERWDDEQGHHYTSYSPKLYYEVRRTGLALDTALTKREAIARYGVFRGFTYAEKPGIRVRKLQ